MNQKGAVMPVILIICFIFSALLFFQLNVFVNEKQNIRHEQQVLNLEWLLRNAEQKWTEDADKLKEGEGIYYFSNGKVQYQKIKEREGALRVDLKAEDELGNQRSHYFYIEENEGDEE
ncbi:competence type IV pilus minor pilin ComGG [Alteribacillus sp. JSM 102045]|uniref:competence type IV pilus minor pilin ComGG n=1 Tax=Alteribacillus sp. JSM 102045 TaxID=1562101 RepID=UPI0035C0B897